MRRYLLLSLSVLFFALPARAACPASVPSGITVCKYVDYVGGNDLNSGTDETHAWKHARWMLSKTTTNTDAGDDCTSNCASDTPTAGNGYILKGGSVWKYTTAPWFFTWSGTGSTSTYGCTGSGCIYVGYDPTWNQGTVNAVNITRDLGGCSPSSPPTVSFSGGGGSGAAATAYVVPAAAAGVEPNLAGLVYQILMTNPDSGYTSPPTVTVTGTGCNGTYAVADIYRPIFDLGSGSGIDWGAGYEFLGPSGGIWPNPAFTILNTSYVIVDHLEIRNMMCVTRGGSGAIETTTLANGGSGYNPGDQGYINYSYSVWQALTVNGSGAILTYGVGANGSTAYAVASNVGTTDRGGATGTGFTINITAVVNQPPQGIQVGFLEDVPGEGSVNNTFENNYVHNLFADCQLTSCGIQYSINSEDKGMLDGGSDEVSGNFITDGESFLAGTSGTAVPLNDIATSAEFGISAEGEVQHNRISWGVEEMNCVGGYTLSDPPLLNVHDNEEWAVTQSWSYTDHADWNYCTNGYWLEYNNVLHSGVSPASNQKQMGGTNGALLYMFNNVSWAMGDGTANWGLDETGGGHGGWTSYPPPLGTVYNFNNTEVADYTGLLTENNPYGKCGSDSQYVFVTTQNNHVIDSSNPFFGVCATTPPDNWMNQAGSSVQATIQASSVTQTMGQANGQSYSISNAFAPTASSNATVQFQTNANSANYTFLCSNPYLAAACFDINGNSRPTTGGWQAGAYQYSGASSTPSAPAGPMFTLLQSQPAEKGANQ